MAAMEGSLPDSLGLEEEERRDSAAMEEGSSPDSLGLEEEKRRDSEA